MDEHESKCPLKVTSCVHKECSWSGFYKDLSIHLSKQCFMRPIQCEFCDMAISASQEEKHYTICEKYPIDCNLCKNVKVPRHLMLEHQDVTFGNCEASEGPCPFSTIRCSLKEKRDHLREKNHIMTFFYCV